MRTIFTMLVLVSATISVAEENGKPGIEKLKQLKFEIAESEKEERIVGGLVYGPDHRWCSIAPRHYLARTEPGMLLYLLEDKTIDSLSLYPGPYPEVDVLDRYIYLGDNVLEDLPKLTHLRQLSLGRLDFSKPNRIAYLKPLNELTHLSLDACSFTLLDLSKLEASDKLVSVSIRVHSKRENVRPISKKDILKLAEVFPNLERINYKSNDTFDAEALEAFGEFASLTHLSIRRATPLTLEYTQEHLDALKGAMVPLKKRLPDLNGRIEFLNMNWNELDLEVPIQKEDER